MWCGSKSNSAVGPAPTLPGKDLLQASALCQFSYSDPDQFRKETTYFKPDIIELVEDKATDAQVYVMLCKTDRVLYVAFRGTSSKKDMAADNKTKSVPLGIADPNQPNEKIEVVEGFMSQLIPVKERLLKFIEDNAVDFDELFITGHSLGGALATIFVTIFHHHNAARASPLSKNVKCVTYGCPRVGNVPFTKFYTSCIPPANHWRVHHIRDIISRMPPPITHFHVPGNAVCIRGFWSDRYTVEQEDTLGFPRLGWDGLKFHQTVPYLKSTGGFFPGLKEEYDQFLKLC